MAHEGGHEEADEAGADEQHDGVPFAEGDGVDEGAGEVGVLQGEAEGEAAGDEPEGFPAHLPQVVFGDDLGDGEDGDGDDGDGVAVQADVVAHDPEEDGDGEGDVDDDGFRGFEEFAAHFEFNFFLVDGEHFEQQEPCDDDHDDDEGDAEEHPFAEGDAQAHVAEGFEGDGVGGGADGGADAADVGGDGDAEGEGGATAVFRGEDGQDGGQDGEHHGGGGGVAHEHGEEGGDAHEPEQDEFRVFAEGFEQDFGEVDVESVFGGGCCQEEAAEEEDDDGVREGGHGAFLLHGVGDFDGFDFLGEFGGVEAVGGGAHLVVNRGEGGGFGLEGFRFVGEVFFGGGVCLGAGFVEECLGLGLDGGSLDACVFAGFVGLLGEGQADFFGAEFGFFVESVFDVGFQCGDGFGVGGAAGLVDDGADGGFVEFVGFEEGEGAVGEAEQGEGDDEDGGGPDRDGFEDPHERCHGEEGDDAGLDDVEVEPEGFEWYGEHAQADDEHDEDFDEVCF